MKKIMVLVLLITSGCASLTDYEALKSENEVLRYRLEALQIQRDNRENSDIYYKDKASQKDTIDHSVELRHCTYSNIRD